MESQQASRTLRVLVAGWVIDDGSFPKADVGDIVDVSISIYSEDGTQTACDDTRTAIARPAHGCAPRTFPSGQPKWLHLVYGDAWSSTWWADRRYDGKVTVSGTFSADLENGALDTPPRTFGRITRIQLVERQVRREKNGWGAIRGTERLQDWDGPSSKVDWWPPNDAQDGDYVPTGLLVELDLDDVPDYEPRFRAGALSVAGDILWVVDRREPVLRRVDTSVTPPLVTEFVLPLPFELDNGMWSRRIHAFGGGCWLTSEWDIYRCTYSEDGALSVDRYAIEGGANTTLYDGRIYVVGHRWSGMSSDRRHGAIRTPVDPHPLQVLDEASRELLPINDSSLLSAVKSSARRADRALADDGSEWRISSSDSVLRKNAGGEAKLRLDPNTEPGTVQWITPDP